MRKDPRGATRFLPAAVLASGCLLIGGVRQQSRLQPVAPLASIPAAFGEYRGTDQTIAAEERRVAGMSDYVMRVYARDSASAFSVYVGYYDYQVQGKTIHSPRNCLPGAGWEVLQGGTIPIDVAGRQYRVNRYLLANGRSKALVYYWYQGRGRVEANEYRVKWNLLRDAALTGRTEESLVRIVMPVGDSALAKIGRAEGGATTTTTDEAALDTVATRVAHDLIPAVSRIMPPARS
ncbi:MAG TPA: EpsI family protein [Gemmatimonadaceae bacterium]|nr:EpsI family protein [Gemmatimonadaceae bacterium]